MLHNRGLVFKAGGIAAVCPTCKGDVAVTGDMAKALSARLLLVFSKPA